MDNQPPIIVSSGAPVAPPTPGRKGGLGGILIAVLALGTVGFGLASILAFSQAHTATTTLSKAKADTAAAAKAVQKAEDDKANTIANQSPYRGYTAPDTFGGFVINFPKNWNIDVDLEENSQTQVSLVLQPNMVRTVKGVKDLEAAKITLVQKTMNDFLKDYTSKKVVQSNVVVSGIASKQLTGTLPDARAKRIVVVPVRDKVLVFDNEDTTYAGIFDTILAQSKINP